MPRPLRALFLAELRPLLVRYVFRDRELESAMRSHDEGPQKEAMLMGIKGYHQAMVDQNPPRGLLESPEICRHINRVSPTGHYW